MPGRIRTLRRTTSVSFGNQPSSGRNAPKLKVCFAVTFLLLICSACEVKSGGKGRIMSKPLPVTTHCVGRNLVDIPSSFVLAGGVSGTFKILAAPDQDPPIELIAHSDEMTPAQFTSAVMKRRAELQEAGSSAANILELDKEVGQHASLFRFMRIKEAFVSEINFLEGSTFVTLSLNSFRGGFLKAEESLMKFMAQVKQLDSSNCAGKRFCVGTVGVSGEFKEESAHVRFYDSEDTGSAFDFLINTFQPDPEIPLLKRISGADSLLKKFDTQHKVLRERELTVAGMAAQEWLGSILLGTEQNQKQFGFAMETMRSSPAMNRPRIWLAFDTGQPQENGAMNSKVIQDEEALRLWDTVTNSIRTADVGR
jgi:hypothetical protein